ncbi:N-acetylmannosamine-6-phosphate 2-epimerase [Salsuginibacillus kocurii]|uniref:N-acetylmannosamine-6-phosphate 2-epimerase n=1 Tax=Salsuginibacillus kocurii TaxID=427078 RepID=UPI000381A215|nr:N-acetylmannosamine-6-phosphate 2-epimerase [Salsuginibacillus kocurii]
MEAGMLQALKGKLVVSCQALAEEPLHSSFIMGRMAKAAAEGGASAIRANSGVDIKEIKGQVDLPVIGIVKKDYPDSPVFITPTAHEVDELIEANVEMIAMDATSQPRPQGEKLTNLVEKVRQEAPSIALMADVSTIKEAKQAEELGFDCISTTLAGYTSYTEGASLMADNFSLLKEMIRAVSVPVIAEGKVSTPSLAQSALKAGAYCVVVGSAITRPQEITKTFTASLEAER